MDLDRLSECVTVAARYAIAGPRDVQFVIDHTAWHEWTPSWTWLKQELTVQPSIEDYEFAMAHPQVLGVTTPVHDRLPIIGQAGLLARCYPLAWALGVLHVMPDRYDPNVHARPPINPVCADTSVFMIPQVFNGQGGLRLSWALYECLREHWWGLESIIDPRGVRLSIPAGVWPVLEQAGFRDRYEHMNADDYEF